MAKADLRATLESIAAGRAPAPTERVGLPVIEPDHAAHKSAYAAWHTFCVDALRHRAQGEPLVAPSAALTPLP